VRRSILSVLALGFLLPTLLGKEPRKIDPRLKSVHTIFVQGRDDPWVRNARKSLEMGGCFQLAPNAENADALMTVLWLSESRARFLPPGGAGIIDGTKELIRSTVSIEIHEGGKLKRVWDDSIDLDGSEEASRSGVRRLIEKLSQEVCAEPHRQPEAPEVARLATRRAEGTTLVQPHEPRALTYAVDVSSVVTWPLPELLKAIPELEGLEPAENQEELPGVLQKVGENVKAYFDNFPNTASVEEITMDRRGLGFNVSDYGAEKFQYLALARPPEDSAGLDEYRTTTKGKPVEPRALAGSYCISKGFVSTPLHFLPSRQADSTFRYLGRQVVNKRQGYVVAFAQRPSVARTKIRVSFAEMSVWVLVQGIAWIDSSTYQILLMRTDLLPHKEEIGPTSVTTGIEFREVHFKESPRALWLPREVVVRTVWNGYTYLNKHHYSNFRLFVVDTEEKVKAPHDAPSG
jgi:hypothetical protein